MFVKEVDNHRFLFKFHHVLNIGKVVDYGPWTFEQNLLLFKKLAESEDSDTVPLTSTEMWVQVHNIPIGFRAESILENIGNYVGQFLYSDPTNFTILGGLTVE